ncbi:MAG: fumarylacetoacetate hydrolase family protein [Candidatus Aramenus sp.]|nr:fumarylacetoacetate hydrolase family protein [Candidatus Aramenus sp.]
MKLLSFSPVPGEGKRVGVLLNGRVVDLAKAYEVVFEASPPNWFFDLKEFVAGGDGALLLAKETLSRLKGVERAVSYDPEKIVYYPPIERPEKILLLAVNYKSHGNETSTSPPKEPYLFTKFANALVGHNQPVIYPKASSRVDHEVELAVVIGKRGKYIPRKEAFNYVFGYTIANDVSFRDKQFPPEPPYGMRWVHGKGMDTAMPLGPWIVTRDELDPNSVKLTLRVNGEVRQEGYAEDMIFKVDEVIEYASNGITLSPGDVISTGTPQGVALATGKYLKPGDVMEAEITGIGVLRNYLVEEK